MRKLVCLLLSVLLLTALVIPASAEGEPMFTVTAPSSSVKAGHTVTLTVTATENAPECCAFAVLLDFSTDVFEVQSVNVEGMAGGFSTGVSETGPKPSVGGLNAQPDGSALPAKPTGKVGTVVLKAKKDAALGEAAVTCTANLIPETPVDGTVNNVTITVTDPNVVDVLLGDADGNGCVDFDDAILIAQYDIDLVDADQIGLSACDVDGNGYVDFDDAILIAQYDIDLIDKFPAETKK